MLKNKHILVGITGGIAAYKAAILVRLLIKAGAEVRVLMTPFAKHFIQPLTLATLSKNPVITQFYNPENGDWNSHVDIGLWADAFIIAPATANTMGKAANGIADNLLLTSYLSARCPVFWAPAMDLDMFQHPAVQANIETLKSYGNQIVDAEIGELASGLDGKGRMAEPEHILKAITDFFIPENHFKAKILITAGPTYEAIDPVRFIGNHSTGKMGYALAEALAGRGAQIELVSGPVNLSLNHPNIKITKVTSAVEMFEASKRIYGDCDITVFAAAVADYVPENPENQKIKKSEDRLLLQLKKNPDIAAELGKLKSDKQINIGFALETQNGIEHAKQKIKAKNFDLIILNTLEDEGAGFGTDTNKITLIDTNNNTTNFELKLKHELAKDIANVLFELYQQKISK